MPKFHVEITIGVNASELAQAESGYKRLGSSAEDARKHVEALATSNDKGSAKIREATVKAAASFEKFAKSVEAGGAGSDRALLRLNTRLEELRGQVLAAQKAGSPVPPAALATLQALENQTNDNVRALGRLRAEQEDLRDSIRDSKGDFDGQGRQIHSLGDIFDATGGKVGRYGLNMLAAAGAMRAGWEIGTQLRTTVNELGKAIFGVDQAMDQFIRLTPAFIQGQQLINAVFGGGKDDVDAYLAARKRLMATNWDEQARPDQFAEDEREFWEWKREEIKKQGEEQTRQAKQRETEAQRLRQRYIELRQEIAAQAKAWELVRNGMPEERARGLAEAAKTLRLNIEDPRVEEYYLLEVALERAAGWSKALASNLSDSAKVAAQLSKMTNVGGEKLSGSGLGFGKDVGAKDFLGNLQAEKIASVAQAMRTAFEGVDSVAARIAATLALVVEQMALAETKTQRWAIALQAAALVAAEVNKPTAGGFGGKGEGNYSGEGAIAGAVIGAIVAAYFTAGAATEAGAAIGAAAGSILGSFIKKGASEAMGSIVLDSGELSTLISKSEHGLGGVLRKLGLSISGAIDDVMTALGGTLTNIPKVSLKVRDGVINVMVGAVAEKFKSMDEAVAFAVSELLKQSNTIGLSDTIKKVLANTDALDLGSLAEDLDFGRWFEQLGLGDAGARIQQLMTDFRLKLQKSIELGLGGEPVVQWAVDQFEDMRRAILGLGSAAADQLENLLSFQRGADAAVEALTRSIAETQAELERALAGTAGVVFKPGGLDSDEGGFFDSNGNPIDDATRAILDKIPALRDALARYTDQLDALPRKLTDQEIEGGIFDVLDSFIKGSKFEGKYAEERTKLAKFRVNLEFELLRAKIIEMGKWAEFQEMFNDAYNAALAGAAGTGGRRNRGRGGGGGSDRRDARADIREEVAGWGLSGVASQLRDAGLWLGDFAERIREAGFRGAEAAALLADAQAELARRNAEIKRTVLKSAQDFIRQGTIAGGPLMSGLRGVDEGLTDLVGDLRDLKDAGELTGREFRDLKEQLEDAAEAARGRMVDEAGQGFLMDLYALLGEDEKVALLKYQLALAEFQIRRAELALAMEAYGILDNGLLAELDGLIERVRNAGPGLFGGAGGPATGATPPPYAGPQGQSDTVEHGGYRWKSDPNTGVWTNLGPVAGAGGPPPPPPGVDYGTLRMGGGGADDPAKALADAFKRATDMLKDYADKELPDIVREIRKIDEDFKFIGDTLGNTAEVINAKARAIAGALDRWLEPVRDFRRGMDFAGTSTLRGDQQFFAARDEFRQVATALLGGDLAQRDRFLELAGLYRDLGRGFTAGEGFRFIDSEIKGLMDRLLAQVPGFSLSTAPLGTPSNPTTMQAPALQATIETGNTMLLAEMRLQTAEMRLARQRLDSIDGSLQNPLSVRDVA